MACTDASTTNRANRSRREQRQGVYHATEAAKLRDMKQTRAELDVLIAGHDERKAARVVRATVHTNGSQA